MAQGQARFALSSIAAALVVVLCAGRGAAVEATPARDWRTWPFGRLSPWNHPIGSGAMYAATAGLASYPAGLNFDLRWTSSVVVASASDPRVTLLFSPAIGPLSTWSFLNAGGQPCGNPRQIEIDLVAASQLRIPFEGNYYSTTSPVPGQWWLPASFHRASQDFRQTFNLPPGACPSPDSDGMMAVFQPDGWVVDLYAGVVTSDGRVLATMASWIDVRGDGTGWWNGRRASMLPSFAGLIRDGEIDAGHIPHALALQVPATMLARAFVWPAFAFDRDADYSGSLPMGALLAIPSWVDIDGLGLSRRGRAIAQAAQDYGAYVVDRGGGGITFLAELGASDIRWAADASGPGWWHDIQVIKNSLYRVANNGPSSRGGGGTPRAPFAPDLPPIP